MSQILSGSSMPLGLFQIPEGKVIKWENTLV